MTESEDVAARFDDAKTLLSFGAACVWMADLDLLRTFYERASSAQEVAEGSVTLGQSLSAAHWRALVEAAIAFKATVGPFGEDVQTAVRERVLSATPRAEAEPEGDAGDLVREEWRCPSCGERRMDWLPIQDDESVRCGTCGLQYRLPGEEEEPR